MALTGRLNRRVREWLDGTRSSSGNPFPMGLREWKDLDLASRLDQLAMLGETAVGVGADLIGFDPDDADLDSTNVGACLRELRELLEGVSGGPIDASLVNYDNDDSGLSATNAKAALDELDGDLTAYIAALASTASGEGASLVGIHDTGGIITATTVEGALAEIQARVTTYIADLVSTAVNKGASLIGINDVGGIITATTVEAALQEIQARITTLIADLASTATSKGASLIGIFDTAGRYAATTVEAALAELRAEVVYSTPKVYPEGVGSSIYAGTRQDDFFDPPWDGAVLHSVRATPINGLTTSAGGTLKMDVNKLPWDGTATAVSLMSAGTPYNMTGANGFVNKTTKVLDSSSVLVSSAATRTIALGTSVRVGINTDALSDLSGGSGWLITCGWSRT